MVLLRHSSFRILCALFACFMIAGDVVADAVHDATGACAAECETSGHDSCPACGCTIHTGSAMAFDASTLVIPAAQTSELLAASDDQTAPGASPGIDHPPQLA